MTYPEYKSAINNAVQATLSQRLSARILTKTADLGQIYDIFKNAGTLVPIGSSFIDPTFRIDEGDIVRSEVLNELQARMSDDLNVMYNECNGLDDFLYTLDRFIRDTLETQLRAINEASSKVTDYTDLKITEVSGYTDIIHNTFSAPDNVYSGIYTAVVDRDSETLKIYSDSTEKLNMAGQSIANVFVLSKNVQIVEISDISKIHSSDNLDPFYVSVLIDGEIENPDSLLETDLTGYNGLIIALRISLSINTIINQIRLRPFSTDKVDILDIYLSTSPNTPIETSGTSSVVGWYKMDIANYNDNMFFYELNGTARSGIPAREVLIILGQKDYMLVKDKVAIRKDLSNLIDIVTTAVAKQSLEYDPYRTLNSENKYNDPFKEAIRKVLADIRSVEIIDVKGLLKHYILGVSTLEVNRVIYGVGGIYISPIYQAIGNVMDVLLEDNSRNVIYEDIVSACVNYDVYISESVNIPIAPISEDDPEKIYDAVPIELSTNESYTFMAGTRFRPHDTDHEMICSYNSKNYTGSSILVTDTPSGKGKGIYVFFNIPDAIENDIIILTYKKADSIGGLLYETNRVDMIDYLGRPNILSEDLMKAIVLDYYIFKPNSTDKKPDYESDDYIYVDCDDCKLIKYEDSYFLSIPNSYSGDVGTAFDDLIPYDELKSDGSAEIVAIPEGYYNGPEKGIYFGFMDISVPNTTSQYVGTSPVVYDIPNSVTYRRGSLIVKVNGIVVTRGEQYSEWVPNTDPCNRLYLWNIENNTTITLSFLPIKPYINYSSTIHQKSNIRTHNKEELFQGTNDDKSIQLRSYPYIDFNIIGSDEWFYSNGVFTYKRNISVTYEPLIITVGGLKAFNITDYIDRTTPVFSGKRLEYYNDGDKLFFSKVIQGDDIRINYYTLVDVLALKVSMLRSDSVSDMLTPVVYSYTLLANVRK